MFEKLMKLYIMAMANDVRSPMPHVVGPPGCGKSTMFKQLADLLNVQLHIINLSRISPLELEGVQMPYGIGEEMKLKLLHATFWTQIKQGDIVLFEECLRAFPEVFNGLIDILTSREVGGMPIPPAFFVGASNSVVTYDSALEDRLIHLPVPDLRTNAAERKRVAAKMVEVLGLMPEMVDSFEMQNLITTEIAPMYDILDAFKKKGMAPGASLQGKSIRNLIGQAQLREVDSTPLKELLDENNQRACAKGNEQYVLLYDGKKAQLLKNYEDRARQMHGHKKLTELQNRNIGLSLQLIELEKQRLNTTKENIDDGLDDLLD